MAASKSVVLDKIEDAWRDFNAAVALVPSQRIDGAGVVEEWSAKDLIGHVATWDKELIRIVGGFLDRRDGDIGRCMDVDAFNKRTVLNNKAHPLIDLLTDLETTHGTMVKLVETLPQEDFELQEVQWRIQIDTHEHYREHTQHISDWLSKSTP